MSGRVGDLSPKQAEALKQVGSEFIGGLIYYLNISRPPVVYLLLCLLILFITKPGKRSVKTNVNRPRSVWCHFD